MKKVVFRYLSQEDIMDLDISWDSIIKRIEVAVSEQAKGTIENPPKRGIHTRGNAFIHEMPVHLQKADICGIKWVSGYPDNYKYELPQILGLQIMNCPVTGVPTAVMDCRWITAVRTAAATAVTAKHCARKNTKSIGIIGAGVQGKMHLEVLKKVLPSITACKVYDVKDNVLNDFAERMPAKAQVDVYPQKSVEDAVTDVDMIITCTQKLPHPIIPDWAMKPGMMGVGIEAGRAWPAEIIHGCDKVVTDDIAQTSSYATTGAFAGGIPSFYCQLGDLVNGKPGRETEEERIMVFNLGIAACDISLGQLVVERAEEKNAGINLTLMERDF